MPEGALQHSGSVGAWATPGLGGGEGQRLCGESVRIEARSVVKKLLILGAVGSRLLSNLRTPEKLYIVPRKIPQVDISLNVARF